MNPLFKLLLKFASSPRIDMQEDYVWVRKLQNILSRNAKDDYRVLDEKIYSIEENHEIPVRVFFPKNIKHEENIIYIHGGGWVLGNIDTYTRACANLAEHLGRPVYSIDYRLAPEYPYPAGFNDCLRVVKVLLKSTKNNKKRKWVLMGDSAGGNLAAAVSLKLKEEGEDLPKKQIMLYPITYWDHSPSSPFESLTTYGYDYGLTIKKITEYMEMYVPDEETRKSPFVAPLMAKDLTEQPDTLVITSEYDPLRDEGEAYGEALKAAGNRVEIHRLLNSVHGFIAYPPYLEPLETTYKMINDFLDDRAEEDDYGGKRMDSTG